MTGNQVVTDGFRFVQLTPVEIETFISAWRAQQEWRRFVDFALDWFGPLAHAVEVVVGSEYNDETYDPVIEKITVSDMSGRELYLDEANLTTPWWGRQLDESAGDPDWSAEIYRSIRERRESGERDNEWRDDVLQDLWGEEVRMLDIPDYNRSFLVNEPPTLPIPAIYRMEI